VDFALSALQDRDHIVDGGFMSAPVLYDLDGQAGLEIIGAAMDGYIYVWHADGTPMAPYPIRVGSLPLAENQERIVATPAVGDIDGDGKPEIAVGSSEALGAGDAQNEALAYVIDAETGEYAAGWPQSLYGLMVNVLPIVGRGVPSSAILADLDYDGTLEISFDTISTQGWIFEHDGSIYRKMDNRNFGALSDSTDTPSYVLMNNGAMGYLDPEGGIDFVKGTAGFDFALAFAGGGILPDKRQPSGAVFDHQVSGWDTDTGQALEGFPRVIDDWQFFNTPTLADIDNDSNQEVIIGSGGYLVHAFNYKGEEPAGWPKQTGGWIIASAGVGDFDGDGVFEVAISTRAGWLYMWHTEGKAGSLYNWNGFGHDPHNTNNFETDPTPYKTWSGSVTPTPDTGDQPDAGPVPDAGGGSDDTGRVDTGGGSDDTGAGADVGTTVPPKKDDGGCAAGAPGAAGALGGGAAPWLALALLLALLAWRRREV
jgi:hypothetical protein